MAGGWDYAERLVDHRVSDCLMTGEDSKMRKHTIFAEVSAGSLYFVVSRTW